MNAQATLQIINQLIAPLGYQAPHLRQFQPGDKHSKTQFDFVQADIQERIALVIHHNPAALTPTVEKASYGRTVLILTLDKSLPPLADEVFAFYGQIKSEFPQTEDFAPNIYDLSIGQDGRVTLWIEDKRTGYKATCTFTQLTELAAHYEEMKARAGALERVRAENSAEYLEAINQVLSDRYATYGIRAIAFEGLGRFSSHVRVMERDGKTGLIYDVAIVCEAQTIADQLIEQLEEEAVAMHETNELLWHGDF